MSNADNSRIANDAVDTLDKIVRIASLGLAYDKTSVAAAALKDILAATRKFTRKELSNAS